MRLPRLLTRLRPVLAGLGPHPMAAQTPEEHAAAVLDTIRAEPLLVRAFLQAMPKGGDLHIHPSGSVYAESLIAYAAADGLCVARATRVVVAPPCDPAEGRVPVRAALTDQALYGALIDAWSRWDFVPAPGVSGHDQFFAAFRSEEHTSELQSRQY